MPLPKYILFKKTNLRFILVIGLWVLVIGFFVVMAVDLFISGRQMGLFISSEVSSRKIMPEFHNLFTKEAQNKLDTPYVIESKYESLRCNYYYDNKYYIMVSKLVLKTNAPLYKTISEENGRPFDLSGSFSGAGDDFLDMDIEVIKADTLKKLKVYLKGDSITTVIKNDTIICYYLKAKSFSLHYNGASSPNIKAEARHENTPVSILFIKKNKKVYLLIMDKKEAGVTMQPNLLYSLVNK